MNQYPLSPRQKKEISPLGIKFTVSDDGYVRLKFDELSSVFPIHLISGLDEDMPTNILRGAVVTAITGYTEWVTTTTSIITLGWDWQMEVTDRQVQLHRISKPRSNIMLQQDSNRDLGPIKTEILLEIFVDALDWQPAVQKYLTRDLSE